MVPQLYGHQANWLSIGGVLLVFGLYRLDTSDRGLHHSILEKLSRLLMTFTTVKALACN